MEGKFNLIDTNNQAIVANANGETEFWMNGNHLWSVDIECKNKALYSSIENKLLAMYKGGAICLNQN